MLLAAITVISKDDYGDCAIDGGVAAGTLGVVSGFLAAVQRTTIGMFEVVTFPFPQPNDTYRPLIAPEFIAFK